jgi:carbonic anhydrase
MQSLKFSVAAVFLFLLVVSCDDRSGIGKADNAVAGAMSAVPLDRLQAGNERFVSGHPIHPDETLERIRELKKGQHPFAVVVSCSDSRVPPELIFDQGLGDIFSIRTAGNVIGDYELASVEYAVEHLGAKLVLVLGHEDCGAVKAYLEDTSNVHTPGHVKALVEYIRQEEEEKQLPPHERNDPAFAVKANVQHGVHILKQSMPVMKPLVDQAKVTIVGGLYDLDNGKVSFLSDD